MANTLLEQRVTELEKKLEAAFRKLDGTVSVAAVTRLSTLRQAELNELKQEVERLNQIIKNHLLTP